MFSVLLQWSGIFYFTQQARGSKVLMQKEYGKGLGASDWRSYDRVPLSSTPAGSTRLDLWAVRDLILVGHKGPMLATTSKASLQMVETAANELALMMPQIHPVAACRSAASQVNAAQPVADYVKAMAHATWACLGLQENNFTKPFLHDAQDHSGMEASAPKFVVGACQGSGWPRACSYWVSLHAMAARADAINRGSEFFRAVVHIFSGGALFCGGCTQKFRLFNSAFLTADVMKEGLTHQ